MNVLPKHVFIESQFLITAYILSTLTDCWRTGPIDRLLLFFTSTKMYKLGHLGMQYKVDVPLAFKTSQRVKEVNRWPTDCSSWPTFVKSRCV